MIFVDTGILIALYMPSDGRHAEAKEIVKAIESGEYGEGQVSDYVLDELLTHIGSRCGRKKAVEVGEAAIKALNKVHIDEAAFSEAFELFRKSEPLSFTDCSTLVLMKRHGIRLLATFDSGFRGKVKTIGV